MIVVSDTTPITYLLQIRHEFLLQRLYHNIVVPNAVQQELLRFASTKKEAEQLFQADWVMIQEPSSLIDLPQAMELDTGEWEALSLAVEIKAGLVLMDERMGTAMAKQLGLKTIGLLGILIEAKRSQFIPSVKQLLDQLVSKRFFINKDLYHKILSIVNE